MTISSFFKTLYQAFYSRTLYREVAHLWQGLGLKYLLLLVALSWMPFTLMVLAEIHAVDVSVDHEDTEEMTINTILQSIVTQMPPITVENGEASTPISQPYTIKDPAGDALVVIDTTGKVTSLQHTDAFILVTKHDIYLRSSQTGETHYTITELAKQDSFLIDSATLEKWIERSRILLFWFVPLVFFPITVLLSFAYNVIKVLFFSLFGLVITRILKVTLHFSDIFRLAVVANTPVLFFETLALLSPPQILLPYQNLIFFGLSLGYVFFAINANQPEEYAR